MAIDVKNVSVGRDYTFRFSRKGESIVVIYKAVDPNEYSMKPILVVKPKAIAEVTDLGVKWNDASTVGTYFIASYSLSEIPIEKKLVYFGMRFVQ